VDVVGDDEGNGAAAVADAGDDGGEYVGELGRDRSRSTSVLDGAMCSSGISSPVEGSLYWTRLWCESSVSSSTRMPVDRSTSTAAQVQNAVLSSRARSRRVPVTGSPAQVRPLACPAVLMSAVLRKVAPAAVNRSPGAAAVAAASRAAASFRPWSTTEMRAERTGMRSRVRWSIRDLRRLTVFDAALMSSLRTGEGAAHCAQRAGSSAAHWVMSR
jgi:hypothetical protein